MAYFGKSNDSGVYTPLSRELQFQEFNAEGSDYSSNIRFRFSSNEVMQWIPSQSFLTVKLAVTGLSGAKKTDLTKDMIVD